MVFVARGALARAEQEATRGAEIQRDSAGTDTPIPTAGLHWLRGLVMSARGERDEALQCFTEEIAPGTDGHVGGGPGSGIRDPGAGNFQARALFARTPDPGPRTSRFLTPYSSCAQDAGAVAPS